MNSKSLVICCILAVSCDLGETPQPPNACAMTLSNVGAGDFRIEFALATQTRAISAVLHQRWACDESRDFWDVQLLPGGVLGVVLNEGGGPYTSFSTMRPVNDGVAHAIVIRRTSLKLTVMVDGAISGSAAAAQRLGALPPLTADPCVGRPRLDGVSSVCLVREASQ